MLSLQELSLLTELKDATTLKEVVAYCNDSSQGQAACAKFKGFWLSILPQVGFEKEAIAFQPLKDEFWEEFVTGLAEGLVFKRYFDISDDYLNNVDPNELIKLYSPLTVGPNGPYAMVNIPSIKLSPGSLGWVVEYTFDSSMDAEIVNNFVLSSKTGGDDLERVLDLMTILYIDEIKRKIHGRYENNYMITEGNISVGVQGSQDETMYSIDTAVHHTLTYPMGSTPDVSALRLKLAKNISKSDINGNWFSSGLFLFADAFISLQDGFNGFRHYQRQYETYFNVYMAVQY
tara:strand:- start:56807 stop:57673 length:867 start_codon:yes stop_codon:yes gene_type:complete